MTDNRFFVTLKFSLALLSVTIFPPMLLAHESGDLAQAVINECGEREGLPGPTAACIRARESRFGEELQKAYETALAQRFNDAALIRDSQRSWLNYQQTSCQHLAVRARGSVFAHSFEASCLLTTTLDRLQELRSLAQEPER